MPDELPRQTPPASNIPSLPTGQPAGPELATGTGLTPNIAAGLAVLFIFVGGIVFLLIEKRDRYVRFWALQSIIFGGAWFALRILTSIIDAVFRGPFGFVSGLWNLLAWFAALAFLIFYIVMLVKAFSGKEWELPLVGKIARQQLGRLQP